MTINLTEAEMRKYADEIRNRYPWTMRDNTIYEAELVCYYKVKVSASAAAEMREILNK